MMEISTMNHVYSLDNASYRDHIYPHIQQIFYPKNQALLVLISLLEFF